MRIKKARILTAFVSLLSAAVLTVSLSASAAETIDRNGDGVVDVFDYVLEKRDAVEAAAPFTISVSSVEALVGEVVWVDIIVEHNPQLENINFTLTYDPALFFAANEEGDPDCELGSLGQAYEADISLMGAKGTILFTSDAKEGRTGDGLFARLGFRVPDTAVIGDSFDLNIQNISCKTAEGTLLDGYLNERGSIDVVETRTPQSITTPTVQEGTKGIDVSFWQGEIDFNAVKASGVEYVILRAGYGRRAYQIDPSFYHNYDAAKAAGLPVGIYWYSYALTPEDAVMEAKACLEVLGHRTLDFPVAFDIEESKQLKLKPEEFSAIATAFCGEIEKAGYYASIYGSANPLTALLTPEAKARFNIWVAHYNVAAPAYANPYGMWQYSCKGVVSGIKGDVDLDYAYMDYPSIIAEKHMNGYP